MPPSDTGTRTPRTRPRPWALSEIRQAASRRTRRQPRRSERRAARKRPRRMLMAVTGAVLAGAIAGGLLTNAGGVTEKIEQGIERGLEEVTLPLRHDDIIRQQAKEKRVDPALIAAIIFAESRFRDQTSNAGARGLMQITPQTAKYIEKRSGGKTFVFEDLADPDLNIRYGTFYLRHLIDRYKGNQLAAVAAYNAGPTKVDEWGGPRLTEDGIEFEETVGYVEDVIDKREDYRDKYAKELGL
jgi:soluble lytic murein transglycosylase